MQLILLAICVVAAANAVSVKFKDCGSTEGKIQDVDITPCDNPARCTLHKGTQPQVSISFTPNNKEQNVTAKVTGILPMGIKVNFPLGNPNACKASGLKCPLLPKQKYTYQQSIKIKSEYPDWSVVVQWELRNKNNKDIVCFMVQTKIGPPVGDTLP